MTPTVLVTGAHSFTARHLLPVLGDDPRVGRVVGTDLAPAGPAGLEYVPADLTQRTGLDALCALAPGIILHLAGVASPDADPCFRVNLEGTRNLLRVAAQCRPAPLFVLVSSAAVYGLTRPEESPLVEETPLRPVSAYGASKAAAEAAALSEHRRGVVPVTVLRPFNLIGPGLPRGFAPSEFLHQAREAAAGRAPAEIRVGNLDPERDFVDVRDAARAYVAAAFSEALRGQAVNVASERPVTIRRLLETVLAVVGGNVTVTVDPARVRPVDVRVQAGSRARLTGATGWTPAIALDQSVRDMQAALDAG